MEVRKKRCTFVAKISFLMKIYKNTNNAELLNAGYISARTYRALQDLHINTPGELLEHVGQLSNILRLKRIGPKSYKELTGVISQMDNRMEFNIEEQDEDNMTLSETHKKIMRQAYDMMDKGEGKVKEFIDTHIPDAEAAFKYTCMHNPIEVIEELSKEENIQLRTSLLSFTNILLQLLEENGIIQGVLYRSLKATNSYIRHNRKHFKETDAIQYLITPETKEYLERTYQKLCQQQLSVRAKNYKDKYMPHVEDMLALADKPIECYSIAMNGQNPPKTITEIFEFNQNFKKKFNAIFNMDKEDIEKRNLKYNYPFLKRKQVEFVYNFNKQKGYEPMLFLLYYYLITSESRPEKTYTLFYGLKDGIKRAHEQVAKAMKLTRERVRQITLGDIVIQNELINDEKKWKPYQELFKIPYYTPETPLFLKYKEEEWLPRGLDVFARLISLKAPYRSEMIDNVVVAINKKILPNVELKITSHKLYNLTKGVRAEDKTISILDETEKLPENEQQCAKELLTYLLKNVYNVDVDSNGTILLKQNTIDVRKELYKILEDNGKPMHIDDIFAAFKKKYPQHKYKSSKQIRSFLYLQPHIKAIGKSSHYALDTWDGIYFGSIRNLIVELLSKSDKPMHIDDIYEEVIKYYPKTNKLSLLSTMIDKAGHRFKQVKKGYYGLTSKNYDTH